MNQRSSTTQLDREALRHAQQRNTWTAAAVALERNGQTTAATAARRVAHTSAARLRSSLQRARDARREQTVSWLAGEWDDAA